MTLTRQQVIDLLSTHGLRPSRALGQNFVVDQNTVRRVARLAEVGPGDRVVEIGAGLGSLTLALIETGAEVLALEADRHLMPVLEAVVVAPNVTVVHADAMAADWPALLGDQSWVLVANLPYNIATPLIADLLDQVPAIERMLVMVQREVGERLVASPGDQAYGAVSVKVRYWAEAQIAGEVPATVFHPKPKVDSVLVSIRRRPAPALDREAVDPTVLFELVRTGFATRRKMLRRALSKRVPPAVFEAAEVSPEARAEELDINAWGRLVVALAEDAAPAGAEPEAAPDEDTTAAADAPLDLDDKAVDVPEEAAAPPPPVAVADEEPPALAPEPEPPPSGPEPEPPPPGPEPEPLVAVADEEPPPAPEPPAPPSDLIEPAPPTVIDTDEPAPAPAPTLADEAPLAEPEPPLAVADESPPPAPAPPRPLFFRRPKPRVTQAESGPGDLPTTLHAPAKLTLSLRVVGVRDDGYHLLEAEMVTLDLSDLLELSEGEGLEIDGPEAGSAPAGDDNLVTRALALTGRRASIHLHKRIPVGAGLGGGSADAAAILRWAGIADFQVAARLGADVPFCLVGGRAMVRGVGEQVEPLPMSDLVGHEYTLLTPPVAVSTARVYATWDELGGPEGPHGNDLEPAALAVEPELAKWRTELAEATGIEPLLAGSGGTWFVPGAFPGPGRRVVRVAG